MIRLCQTGQLQTSAGSLPEVRISDILNCFYIAFEPFLITGISLYIYIYIYIAPLMSAIFSPSISRGQPFLPYHHFNHIAPSFIYFLLLLGSFPSSFPKPIFSLLATWSDRPMYIHLLLCIVLPLFQLLGWFRKSASVLISHFNFDFP